ncbi:MAG: PrsW family intramembrane metalloprotease [Anaerolineae bacterium]|jgi:hypothetical protein|nr:PrsW family intramembrane metalloprotease [Anaerolineae bacterium]
MRSVSSFPVWLWGVAALLGLGLFGLGLVFVVIPIAFPQSFGMVSGVVSGYGLLAIGLGIGLIFSGLSGWRGRPSHRIFFRRGWLVFLLAGLALGCLAALLPDLTQAGLVFSAFHFALIGLPGLALILLVVVASGSDAAISFRQSIVGLTAGVSTIILAVPVELIGLMASATLGVLVTLVLPGGAGEVERLSALLQQWAESPPTDQSDLMALLASPTVLVTMVLTLAVVTPVVEELGKTLLLGVTGIWFRPSVRMAFLWGAACGLGFAWFEGIGNSAIGLGGSAAWLGGVGLRVFATAMHCVTSGLVGLGWGWFWQGRKWALPLGYGTAIAFHGLWNLAVILALSGVGLTVSAPRIGYLLIAIGVLVEVGLALTALISLVAIPLVLRKRAAA